MLFTAARLSPLNFAASVFYIFLRQCFDYVNEGFPSFFFNWPMTQTKDLVSGTGWGR